jgi:hypothetical protein
MNWLGEEGEPLKTQEGIVYVSNNYVLMLNKAQALTWVNVLTKNKNSLMILKADRYSLCIMTKDVKLYTKLLVVGMCTR